MLPLPGAADRLRARSAEDAARRFDELAKDGFAALPADAEYLFCLSILSEIATELRDADRAAVLIGCSSRMQG